VKSFHKNCPTWVSQIQYPRSGCNCEQSISKQVGVPNAPHYQGKSDHKENDISRNLSEKEEAPILLNATEKNVINNWKSTICDSEDRLEFTRFVKQDKPQQSVNKIRPLEQSAVNQDIIQEDPMITSSRINSYIPVSRKLVLPSTENPYNILVLIQSRQKESQITAKYSPGLKKNLHPKPKEAMKTALSKLSRMSRRQFWEACNIVSKYWVTALPWWNHVCV
jgi:hypothetical protein